MDRLKSRVIERILPRINLTSFNNVRRVRAHADELSRLLSETQVLLRDVAADRDRLATASDRGSARVLRLSQHLTDVNHLRVVRELLLRHWGDADDDPNLAGLLEVYDSALKTGIPYWDVRASVRAAAIAIGPATYLELGVRRGWSLAQVFAECPGVQAYACDLWVADYAGAQGSPDYVHRKIQEVVGGDHPPRIVFLNGDSHELLPDLFSGRLQASGDMPPTEFDLVTVDGDHTLLGAWWDLYDVFPRVAVGGAIIFDDLDYAGDPGQDLLVSRRDRPPLPACESLRDVWLYAQSQFPNFVFLAASRPPYSTGIAVRIE